MIRFLLRLIGLLILALAFFFLVYDGEKSIANQHMTYTDLTGAWALIDQHTLTSTQNWLKLKAGSVGNPYVQYVFDLPVWAILAFVSMILILLGRKKKPLIGYARN